jgi:hypothetical protein
LNDLLERLIRDFGLERVEDDNYTNKIRGCYHGRVVVYKLCDNLIDILDLPLHRFLASSDEKKCYSRLDETLTLLKEKEMERKMNKLNEDFK